METAGVVAPTVSIAARVAGWFTVAAMFMLVGSPFAYRIGLLGETIAVAIFVIGTLLAACAVVAGLVGAGRGLATMGKVKGGLNSAVSIVISGLAIACILYWMVIPGWGAPNIHDVTTSPRSPPEFDVLRVPHYAARDYVTYEAYDRQMNGKVSAAYPKLRTLVFDKSLRQVFAAAEASARELHWTVVLADAPKGRIEAADWATVFGFIDDIVIRVRLNAAGYVVLDIRSASRTSKNDMGRNAARIERFVTVLKGHLPEQTRNKPQ